MSYRKDLLFVAIVSIIASFGTVSEAKASTLNIETIPSYNYSHDPYLLDWSLQQKQEIVPVVIEAAPLSLDDKKLLAWKKKQEHLWKNLSKDTFTINASAYTAAADECGKSDGVTASGLKVTEKRTLACPKEYPFGAKISIEGLGEYRCEDRGGAIKGNHFDIYVETKSEAFAFGRQNLVAQIVD
jgi:3D (Asp-Asp-Asp) domain-containing protein